MIPALSQLVGQLIHHKEYALPPVAIPRPTVQKKAIMLVQRFHQLDKTSLDHLIPDLKSLLKNRDPNVYFTALTVLHDFVKEDPSQFKDLVGFFCNLLQQIVGRQLPPSFYYKDIPAPWFQMKLLRVRRPLRCPPLDPCLPRQCRPAGLRRDVPGHLLQPPAGHAGLPPLHLLQSRRRVRLLRHSHLSQRDPLPAVRQDRRATRLQHRPQRPLPGSLLRRRHAHRRAYLRPQVPDPDPPLPSERGSLSSLLRMPSCLPTTPRP